MQEKHFKVPHALINFLAKIRSIHSIPFRSLESILKIFSGIMGLDTVTGHRKLIIFGHLKLTTPFSMKREE